MQRLCRLFIVAALVVRVFLNVAPARAQDSNELYRRAILGLKAVIESVESCECKYKISSKNSPQSNGKTFYYARKDDLAIEKVLDGTGVVIMQRAQEGGLQRKIAPSSIKGQARTAWIDPISPQGLSESAIWNIMGFEEFQREMAVKSKKYKLGIPPDHLPAKALGTVGGLSHKGILLREEGTFLDNSGTVTTLSEYDEAYNYLCTLTTTRIERKGKASTTTRKFSKVREVAPGFYLPFLIEVISKDDTTGKILSSTRVDIESWSLNKALSKKDLVITFPGGLTVQDNVRHEIYVSNGSGGSVGPVRPLPPPLAPGQKKTP
jgi:hypothetical protein